MTSYRHCLMNLTFANMAIIASAIKTSLPYLWTIQNRVKITYQKKNICAQIVLRFFSLHHSQSTSGIFPKTCIFCNKARLRKKGNAEEPLGACQTKQAEDAIKAAASARNDDVLLALIADVDFVAKEVMYHHSCKRLCHVR